MITDQIGKNIKSLREGGKMSQKDLANKINLDFKECHKYVKILEENNIIKRVNNENI